MICKKRSKLLSLLLCSVLLLVVVFHFMLCKYVLTAEKFTDISNFELRITDSARNNELILQANQAQNPKNCCREISKARSITYNGIQLNLTVDPVNYYFDDDLTYTFQKPPSEEWLSSHNGYVPVKQEIDSYKPTNIRHCELGTQENTRIKMTKNILDTMKGCGMYNKERSSNILCASARSIMSYSMPDYIPDLRSPCVYILSRNDGTYSVLSPDNFILNKSSETLDVRLGCLPAVYILGYAKSGTTDLHAVMSKHPLIATGYFKETAFWRSGHTCDRDMWLLEDGGSMYSLYIFMQWFKGAAEKISKGFKKAALSRKLNGNELDYRNIMILESSPENILLPTMTQKVMQLTPNARFLVIMKNPIDYVLSRYKFRIWRRLYRNQTAEGFHQTVVECFRNHSQPLYATLFSYRKHVERMLRVVPRKNIHFVKLEEYSLNPYEYANKNIFPFLGLFQIPINGKKAKVYNKNPIDFKMYDETRDILREYFRPIVRDFASFMQDSKWLWNEF